MIEEPRKPRGFSMEIILEFDSFLIRFESAIGIQNLQF